MALFDGIGKKLDKMKDDLAFDNWAPQSARAWGKSEFWGLSKERPGSEGIGLLTEDMLKQLQAEELAKANGGGREEALSRDFLRRSMELDDDNSGEEVELGAREEGRRMSGGRPYDLKERAAELNAADTYGIDSEFVFDGEALAVLCYNKYGFFHDMAIREVQLSGGSNRIVAFNLYFGYVGLRGFPYSDEEYIDKMEAVAALISAMNQEEFVVEFLREKIYPRRGLPSRPRQDTAVTLQLNASPTWDPVLVESLPFFTELM